MVEGLYNVTVEQGYDAFSPSYAEITLAADATETVTFRKIYSGGNGTVANPFQITTRADLLYLSTDAGNWDKHFAVTTDISLSAGSPTETIGNGSSSEYYFTGNFDGQGHTISDFTLNKTSQYSKNESVEAYYNNISEEADTSLPKLVLLGIPMECHFCLIVPAIKLTE